MAHRGRLRNFRRDEQKMKSIVLKGLSALYTKGCLTALLNTENKENGSRGD
jgi:hypothetical protein